VTCEFIVIVAEPTKVDEIQLRAYKFDP